MTYRLTKEEGDAILKEDNGALLLEFVKQIEDFQAAWAVANGGVYFQTPPSHTVPPSALTAADNTAATVPSKGIGWSDFDGVVGSLPFSVEMHEYYVPPELEMGGSRRGYDIILRRNFGGQDQVRVISYGPEAVSRTTDWYVSDT